MQGVGISAPAMVGAGDLVDIGLRQFTVGAIDQGPELAGIDKERLAAQLREQLQEAARLDAAIAANLKELGYGD